VIIYFFLAIAESPVRRELPLTRIPDTIRKTFILN
jgi:hypothetical protein